MPIQIDWKIQEQMTHWTGSANGLTVTIEEWVGDGSGTGGSNFKWGVHTGSIRNGLLSYKGMSSTRALAEESIARCVALLGPLASDQT